MVTTPRISRSSSFPQLFLSTLWFGFFLLALNPHSLPIATAAPASQKLKPNDPYALIFGTVWGPDDRPVYGIAVKIRRAQDKKPRWEISSDHHGEFAQRVPAGKVDYVVWADLKGVKMQDGSRLRLAQEVTLQIEYDERADIGLHLTVDK
jgi:hypothetical protein